MKEVQTGSVTMRKRITKILIFAGVLFLALIFRLAYVQLVQGEWLQQMAMENRTRDVAVEAKRGTIYDCNGNELVTSITADSFYAIPSQVADKEAAAEAIAKTFDLKKADVLSKLQQDVGFVWLKRKADYADAEALKKIKAQSEQDADDGKISEPVLDGIEWVEESRRYYVHETLAPHVLGFVGTDNQGLAGLEAEYELTLRGTEGRIVIEYDAAGQEIPQATHHYYEAESGNNLVLTIDQNIQYFVEQELDNIVETYAPKNAVIVVMDPDTADVLAMGTRPTYDPSKWQDYDSSVWNSNPAVSYNYEPGSTFKIVVAASAMEEQVVDENSVFYDPGSIVVGDRSIDCWDSAGHGTQSFVEIIQNSCNPGFVQLGLDIGVDRLYKYLNSFGFGRVTGIDLTGEETGILYDKDSVTNINLATMSIGQSIAVTPIQLITAVSAIANDGVLMKPRVVKAIEDEDGNVITEFEPTTVKQVVSKETANQLCEYLENVILYGSGTNAYIEGYRVGGKTGTAQVVQDGVYADGKYVASFIGMAPVNDPQVVVLVMVSEPTQNGYYGSQVAAPSFKNVAWNILRYLKVPQQVAGDSSEADDVEVPDVVNSSIEDARNELVNAGLNVDFSGEGTVVTEQIPEAGAVVPEGTKILLSLEKSKDEESSGQVTVPNLSGYTIKEAGEMLGKMGLSLVPQGSGVAASQSVKAGTQVAAGTTITVTFKSP